MYHLQPKLHTLLAQSCDASVISLNVLSMKQHHSQFHGYSGEQAAPISMASTDRPKYIYKITPEPAPSPIPEIYPPSELDAKDGFIHLSTALQVF